MAANDEQVGGTHYRDMAKVNDIQHWDWACNLPYLEGITTGYVGRHAEKDGFKDLLKAFHCLEKMMEVYYPFEWSNHKLKQKERLPQPIEIRSEHIPDVAGLNKANEEFYAQRTPEEEFRRTSEVGTVTIIETLPGEAPPGAICKKCGLAYVKVNGHACPEEGCKNPPSYEVKPSWVCHSCGGLNVAKLECCGLCGVAFYYRSS